MTTGLSQYRSIGLAALPGVLFILIAGGIHAPAIADEARLDLGALLEMAGSGNPALLAERARAEAATRDLPARRLLPDPRVFVYAVNDGYDPSLGSSTDSFVEFGWEQDVPAPGRREASFVEGERLADFALRGAETLQVRLREKIIRLYAEIWRLDRTIELERESRDLLDALAGGARVRYESGEGNLEGILRAQLESRELGIEILHLERERRAAQYALAGAIGRPDESLAAPAGDLPALELPPPGAQIGEEAESRSAEVAEAMAGLDASQAALDRARADRRPDWSWRASYQNRGGLDPMFSGGVGIALPLWKRTKQDLMVARAEAELEAARRDLESARQGARTGVKDWLDEAHHSGDLARRYETELSPQARTLEEAARAAYESGQAEFILVLQDLRSALAVRIAEARERTHQVQAAASLEAALGLQVVVTTPGGRTS